MHMRDFVSFCGDTFNRDIGIHSIDLCGNKRDTLYPCWTCQYHSLKRCYALTHGIPIAFMWHHEDEKKGNGFQQPSLRVPWLTGG